jgi:hypothetical protein
MAAQYEHDLPNGERLHVVDVDTAKEFLADLVAAYDAGTHSNPLVIGDETKPKAVVLPIDQWLDLLDLAEEAAFGKSVYDAARESLADPGPSIPYEELLKSITDPRKTGEHE